jgi:hypothetical protein
MKTKKFSTLKLAPSIAAMLIIAQTFQIQASTATPNATPESKTVAIPRRAAPKAPSLNLPKPQWPFPCPQSGDCHPHWFYLVNGATVTSDQPLVITVTGNFPGANGGFPYPQPEAENGVTEPSVPVGISGSGLTLQPRNTTPYADNQMWYAKETGPNGTNPSFIVSSLPPMINPIVVQGEDATPTTSLGLGYIGNSTLPSPSTAINTIDWSRVGGKIDGVAGGFYNDYATVTTTGTNAFLTGQIVDISGNSNLYYNGVQTVQFVNSNSFTINVPIQYQGLGSGNLPSGSGGTATAMAAVYLLPQAATVLNPTYTTNFLQWNYDGDDRTMCNELGVCLYSVDATPHAGSIVSAGPKPATVTPNYQWHFFPNRVLSEILQGAPVPFPPLDTKGGIKAQSYIAAKLNLPSTDPLHGCTYNGVTYFGLRCQYSNLAAPLSTYVSLLSDLKAPKNVSTKTFRQVKAQLISELSYAIAVQNLFAQVDFVYSTVFLGSSALLNQDLADLGADLTDQTKVKRFSWQTLAEGLLYTGLNIAGALFGDPKAGSQTEKLFKGIGLAFGISANLMETGWNTAMAENNGTNDPLANQFEDTAANLYGYLFDEFTYLGEYIDNQEIAVLQDWGMLETIGLLAQQQPSPDNGFSGLYWDPTVNSALTQKFTGAYQLAIMQQLLPQYFDLNVAVDWVGGTHNINGHNGQYANQVNVATVSYLSSTAVPTALPTPDPSQVPPDPMLLDQFSTPIDAQGHLSGMFDVGWLYMPDPPSKGSKLVTNYLTAQLAQDVSGANPYLLYNGLGTWGSTFDNPNFHANTGSDGTFTTLTNFTPRQLKVIVFSDCSTSPVSYFGGGYLADGSSYGQGDANSHNSDFAAINNATQSGVCDAVDRSLPPYGVLQFGAQGSTQDFKVSVWDYSQSTTQDVASFNVKMSSGTASVPTSGEVTNFGYQLTNAYVSGTSELSNRTPLIGIYGGN